MVPAIPTAEKLKTVPKSTPAGSRVAQQLERIRTVSAQEQSATPPAAEGVVAVPVGSVQAELLPLETPVDHAGVEDPGHAFVGDISEGCCDVATASNSGESFFGINSKSAARQVKRQAAKLKRQARRASRPFVAFYEPEDVDDYHMPILLVGNEEEVEELPESQTTGLLARKLSHIKPTLDYAWGRVAEDDLPDDFHQRLDNGPYVERFAPRTVVQWAPTNLWYYPLYFEDPQLERYGHSRREWIQPFVSSSRFMVQTVGLPYQMTLHPPHCREYALGYYQPGEWAPKKKYQIPWNEEAAATEFLWIMGFILLVP